MLTTTTIVISQNKHRKTPVASIVNDSPSKTNTTCLCTPDEKCIGNTSTCRLTAPHHTCYEKWEVDANDGSIHHTAG